MAISEERFKVEDNEFDLPVADFLSILDTGIKNFIENLLDYFPNIDPFGNRDKDKDTDPEPNTNIWGDNTVVIPLYDVPISEEQADEIDLIIINVLDSYGWYVNKPLPHQVKQQRNVFYGPHLMPILEEGDIPEYPTTHNYFKTSADLIKRFTEWRPNYTHPSYRAKLNNAVSNSQLSMPANVSYASTYYVPELERTEIMKEDRGLNLDSNVDITKYWTETYQDKSWY